MYVINFRLHNCDRVYVKTSYKWTICMPLLLSSTSFGLLGRRVEPATDDAGLCACWCPRFIPSAAASPLPSPGPVALWRCCECITVDGIVVLLDRCAPPVSFSWEDKGAFRRNSLSQSVWLFSSSSVVGWTFALTDSCWWWREPQLPKLEAEWYGIVKLNYAWQFVVCLTL